MTRAELETYLREAYDAEEAQPWMKYPEFSVFRRPNQQKCFAIVMDIPRTRLGLAGEELISVVNLKCDPLLIGSMVMQAGIYPAYHMNKEHWVTVALDGTAEDETLKTLIELSYGATAQKPKARRRTGNARK